MIQVAEFLEMWQLPSTGQLSLPLLHKLKALSGITSEPSASRKLADRKGIFCEAIANPCTVFLLKIQYGNNNND